MGDPFFYPRVSTLPSHWECRSFTELGTLWIASNNYLSPSHCKAREIHDLGSSESLGSPESLNSVNLLNYEIIRRTYFTEALVGLTSMVMRTVAQVGVFTFAAPVGTIWHLGNSIYYVTAGKDEEKLEKHFKAFLGDLKVSASTFTLVIQKLRGENLTENLIKVLTYRARKNTVKLTVNDIITYYAAYIECIKLVLAVIHGLFPQGFHNFFSGLGASYALKKTLGITGEGGWLLQLMNKDKDFETLLKDTISLMVRYFTDLRDSVNDAGELFLELNNLVNKTPTSEELEMLDKLYQAEDPQKLIDYLFRKYLNNLVVPLGDTQTQIDQIDLVYRLDDSLKKCRLMHDLITRSFLLNLKFLAKLGKVPEFSFSKAGQPEDFASEQPKAPFHDFFFGNAEKNIKLNNFEKLLAEVKSLREEPLPGKENSDYKYIEAKNRILKAKNPYEVLGVNKSDDEETYKKAYLKLSRHIHPDKLPDDRKEEAKMLFTVAQAASECGT
jgi:hypothetical protein